PRVRQIPLGARPLLARSARSAAPMPPDPVGQLERSRARPPPKLSWGPVRCSRAPRAPLLRCLPDQRPRGSAARYVSALALALPVNSTWGARPPRALQWSSSFGNRLGKCYGRGAHGGDEATAAGGENRSPAGNTEDERHRARRQGLPRL